MGYIVHTQGNVYVSLKDYALNSDIISSSERGKEVGGGRILSYTTSSGAPANVKITSFCTSIRV